MTTLAHSPEVERMLARTGPYLARGLERAARYALRLHAEELAVEHLLASLLEDEDCGATRLVLHAFADPETLAVEVLALCPGIMVVGSERCLPFSVRGVRALEGARGRASTAGLEEVDPAALLRAAVAELPAEVRAALGEAGLAPEVVPDAPAASGVGSPGADGFLRHFSAAARRALGLACRVARKLERDAIAPAHVLFGCLEADDDLARTTGLSGSRARNVLAGRDEDGTPLPDRALAPDTGLRELLGGLPDRAGTFDVLAWLVHRGSPELRALLARQKVSPALIEHAQGAFADPDPH
jgi:hypothetical protein